MSNTIQKTNKLSYLCKEIRYMNAYSGGQYDQSKISHDLWQQIVKTTFRTPFKARQQFIEADEHCTDNDFKRSLKHSIVSHDRIKKNIKFNIKKKISENKYRMHCKNDYITHPQHSKYYYDKISLPYGFRPHEKSRIISNN